MKGHQHPWNTSVGAAHVMGTDTEGISDPSDWLKTAMPSLKDLDQAFRCYICKDYTRAPMMTACCSRTFCSLCIRRQFTADSRCPMCLKQGSESQLRKNRELEMAIEAWHNVRPGLMKLLTEQEQEPGKEKGEMVDKEIQVEGITDERSGKIEDEEIAEGMAICPVCQKHFKVEYIERVHLAQCLSGVTSPSNDRKSRTTASQSLHSQSQTRSSSPSPHPQQRITPPTSQGQPFFQTATRREQSQPLKKLPKPGLTNVKLAALKARVAKLGISTRGSVQELLRREAEWINIWNANCDALRPASPRVLHQELAMWEAQVHAASVSSVTNEEVNGARGKQKGTVEEARAYSKKENVVFKALARKARAASAAGKKRKRDASSNPTESSNEGDDGGDDGEQDVEAETRRRRPRKTDPDSLHHHNTPTEPLLTPPYATPPDLKPQHLADHSDTTDSRIHRDSSAAPPESAVAVAKDLDIVETDQHEFVQSQERRLTRSQ